MSTRGQTVVKLAAADRARQQSNYLSTHRSKQKTDQRDNFCRHITYAVSVYFVFMNLRTKIKEWIIVMFSL